MGLSKSAGLALVLLLLALGYCIYRDIHLEQQYTSDLRNRVVGARLEMEHISPYFYTWRPGDPVRYYDPNNIQWQDDSVAISKNTATPFLHQLMAPVAGLPERTISRIWLVLEYLLFIACAALALGMTVNRQQKGMVLAAALLFLFTEAWKSHIVTGQYYLLVPFLALLFYYLFRRPGSLLNAAAAGVCAITLVLIRPNTLIFFLPFLFVLKRYSVRYISVFFVPVVLMAGLSLTNPWERSLWKDYRQFVGKSIQMHQSAGIDLVPQNNKPYYTDWEGWHQSAIKKSMAQYPFTLHCEHGNVFLLFDKITHTRLPLAVLNGSAAFIILLLLWLFARRQKQGVQDLHVVAIAGFCLYMVSDLFSPVWRHQYYTVQWLFPVLLAAAHYKPEQRKWFIGIGVALLLNILNTSFIKMEHTIGEYLLLGVLLGMSFMRRAASVGPLTTQKSS